MRVRGVSDIGRRMPDEMYVVRLENDSCKHISITHRRCRLHDIWRSFVRDESRTHYICESSSGIRSCRHHYEWRSSSSLELMSCGVEWCSRGLETTGLPTNRRSSVGGSSQGRI